MIVPPIQFPEPDTLGRPDERTGGLQEESGLVDYGHMLRVILMDLSIAFHLVEVFLIVHGGADHLAGIRHRTQELQVSRRNDWGIRSKNTSPFHHFVEVSDQEVVSWKGISVRRQDFQRSCNISDIRAFNQAQPSVPKPAKSHFDPLPRGGLY